MQAKDHPIAVVSCQNLVKVNEALDALRYSDEAYSLSDLVDEICLESIVETDDSGLDRLLIPNKYAIYHLSNETVEEYGFGEEMNEYVIPTEGQTSLVIVYI